MHGAKRRELAIWVQDAGRRGQQRRGAGRSVQDVCSAQCAWRVAMEGARAGSREQGVLRRDATSDRPQL